MRENFPPIVKYWRFHPPSLHTIRPGHLCEGDLEDELKSGEPRHPIDPIIRPMQVFNIINRATFRRRRDSNR